MRNPPDAARPPTIDSRCDRGQSVSETHPVIRAGRNRITDRRELPFALHSTPPAAEAPSERLGGAAKATLLSKEDQEGGSGDEEDESGADEDEERYAGVVLPHTPLKKFRSPTAIHAHLVRKLMSSTHRLPAMVWDLVDATEPDASTPNVNDASERNLQYYNQILRRELPRHIEITASSVAGVFARLPADGWFGDIYQD